MYRTPTEVSYHHPDSHISLACRLRDQYRPNAWIPDQYTNPNNPLAHYYGTAEEIWRDCEGKIDVIVMGAGTGGTISGVGKRMKELNPNIKIVGVDPVGSILAADDPENKGKAYMVEGIGYDFIPETLDLQVIDKWIKVNDRDSFSQARELIRKEGLLCGGSSGAAMYAAIRIAKEWNLESEKRMVVILPDSVRNYMSKFLSDDWMLIHGYMDVAQKKLEYQVKNEACMRGRYVRVLESSDSATNIPLDEPLVVIREDSQIIGYIESSKFAAKVLCHGPTVYEHALRRHMCKDFIVIEHDISLAEAAAYATTGYPVFRMDSVDQIAWLEPQIFL